MEIHVPVAKGGICRETGVEGVCVVWVWVCVVGWGGDDGHPSWLLQVTFSAPMGCPAPNGHCLPAVLLVPCCPCH